LFSYGNLRSVESFPLKKQLLRNRPEELTSLQMILTITFPLMPVG
jgi:hypothetical protein